MSISNVSESRPLGIGRFLARLVRRHPGFFLPMVLAAFVSWALVLHARTLAQQGFFDSLIDEAAFGWRPHTWAMLIVGAIVAFCTVWTVDMLTSAIWQFKCGTTLRKNLFAHVLTHPGAQALPSSAGETVSRFRGDVEEAERLATFLIRAASRFIYGIIAFSIMAQIHAQATLFVFLPMAAIVTTACLSQTYVQRYREENRRATGDVTGLLGEIFSTVQAVKVACAERSVLERFTHVNEERQKRAVRDRIFEQLLNSLNGTYATGIILILVAQPMQEGTFSVGDLSLFVLYLGMVSYSVGSVGALIVRFRQTRVSLARLDELLGGVSPTALVDPTPVPLRNQLPVAPNLSRGEENRFETLLVDGLSYRFPDGSRGVEGIDLVLKRGTLTVITGRIGSGKTTLLRALLGLLPTTAGEIRWNRNRVDDPARFLRPPRAAYTAQIPTLFSESLAENILLGTPQDGADLDAAVRSAVLEDDLKQLEKGLDTIVGPRGVKLSGGQRQRVAAARMFVREAELLVFDDLSSALDLDTEQKLWERLLEQRDKTCLAVSHRPMVLRRADHIVVLNEGRIEDEGTLQELMGRSEEIRRIFQT